jgi:hypothetical protein
MGESEDDSPEKPGGRAARRLEDFLKRRLPPGVSAEELNPELAEKNKDKRDPPNKGSETDQGSSEQ